MIKFEGIIDNTAKFLQKEQLSNPELWAKFVDVYRTHPDGANNGWRGEYWGKMMRGGALVYKYTRDSELYRILTDSVKDMISTADEDGRVSSYPREKEFCGWDLWSRKYVILACEYYLEICEDESFKQEIIEFIKGCADYVIKFIGEDKIKITSTSTFWYGLNSSSILEPIVRLYRLTGEKRYLDFATYIVNEGGGSRVKIFDLAYENRLYPYQYGVAKAYEMTSCFEGLLEYYKATGIEKYKTSVINFAEAVLDSEMSIIGSCGMTHELFDHTRTRQTTKYDGVMQETCVTVTIMKFFGALLDLTGDTKYADVMEKAFYNAYLGALNTEHKESIYAVKAHEEKGVVLSYMPLDSYSPLTAGKRGQMVGGFQILPDKTYYGCCACIGSAGLGVFADRAICVTDDGITVNFYEKGFAELDYKGTKVSLNIETDYPVNGKISIKIKAEEPVEFSLKLRNPGWTDMPKGYTEYKKVWDDDTVELCFDMPIRIHRPEHWESDAIYTIWKNGPDGAYFEPLEVIHTEEEDNYVAVTRGPLTLAADDRLGKLAASTFKPTYNAEVSGSFFADGVPCLIKMKFAADGEDYYLVDYASAGHDWESDIAAWLKI